MQRTRAKARICFVAGRLHVTLSEVEGSRTPYRDPSTSVGMT